MTPLNARQNKFVAEYLVDQNATQAAARAGYKGTNASLRVSASKMLTNPNIKAAVDAGLANQSQAIEKRANLTVVDKAAWLKRLEDIGFADIGQAFTEKNGKLVMTIADMKASGFSKIIRKMKVHPNGTVEIDLLSALPALELLAKHYGWVKEIHQHEGSINTQQVQEAEFREIFSDPAKAAMALQFAEMVAPPVGQAPAKGVKRE